MCYIFVGNALFHLQNQQKLNAKKEGGGGQEGREEEKEEEKNKSIG